jgi:transposase-like protein
MSAAWRWATPRRVSRSDVAGWTSCGPATRRSGEGPRLPRACGQPLVSWSPIVGSSCHLTPRGGAVGRRGYPPEFRRKVLDLVASGRKVSEVAFDLEISEQTIYSWRRQDRIDRGLEPGLTTPERAGLRAAERRIAELEAELAIHRRAVSCWARWCPQKAVRGHRGNGRRGPTRAGLHPRPERHRLRVLRLADPGPVGQGGAARVGDRGHPPGSSGLPRDLRLPTCPCRARSGARPHRRSRHRGAADGPRRARGGHRRPDVAPSPPGPAGRRTRRPTLCPGGRGPAVGRRITEHPTREGKVYCAVVLDVCSRRVVGWSIDSSPTAALVTNALGMAIDTRRPTAGTGTSSTSDSQTGLSPYRCGTHLLEDLG